MPKEINKNIYNYTNLKYIKYKKIKKLVLIIFNEPQVFFQSPPLHYDSKFNPTFLFFFTFFFDFFFFCINKIEQNSDIFLVSIALKFLYDLRCVKFPYVHILHPIMLCHICALYFFLTILALECSKRPLFYKLKFFEMYKTF